MFGITSGKQDIKDVLNVLRYLPNLEKLKSKGYFILKENKKGEIFIINDRDFTFNFEHDLLFLSKFSSTLKLFDYILYYDEHMKIRSGRVCKQLNESISILGDDDSLVCISSHRYINTIESYKNENLVGR